MSPWAKPGAWALDAEQHEEEELLQQQQQQQQNSAIHAEPLADFPSLSVAAASAPAKSKKKKGQTLSLAEFSTYKPGQVQQKQSQHQPQGLTTEELLALPTGPRQRTEEEIERDRTRLGGGFRSYGLSNGDSGSRWGSSRVSDEGRRNRESNREPLAPSRADETDDWGAAKKTSVGSNGLDRRERGERGGERGERGGFFNSQSRADDSDNWGSSKAFAPTEGRRFSSERKVVGFASNGGADSSENWGRNKKEESVAAGGDRPRLNLQPRTLPVVNIEKQEGEEPESKVFVPVAAAPRSVNPFGAARPREDVLAEKGQDWKKIDEQLEAVKIKETVPEKLERRRSFGLGNGRAEDRTERTWRKPDSPVESRPQRFVELCYYWFSSMNCERLLLCLVSDAYWFLFTCSELCE